MTTLQFFPRSKLVEALQSGWRLLADHSYNVADYAILLSLPDIPQPITPAAIRTTAARFNPKPIRSNKSAAATSRMVTRPRRPREVA